MSIFGQIKNSTWIKINCALTVCIAILLLRSYFENDQAVIRELEPHEINACCGIPCQNGGVCIPENKGYSCDCIDTGYSGKNCEEVLPRQWINKLITFNPTEACTSIINYLPFLGKFLNSFSIFQTIFTRNLYMTTANWGNADFRWATAFSLVTVDSYKNFSSSARSLPPVPKMCPTPMGVRGPKLLPSSNLLYEKLLKRKHFQVCSKGTNILFATYIQHFVSQFDSYEAEERKQHDWGNNIIDMSHIYGKYELTRNALRSFTGGKLKCRYFMGEQYPPYLEDCPGVNMIYPQKHPKSFLTKMMMENKVVPRWALGNPGLSMTPMLFAMSTIWLREHNRVCNILAKEHKYWTDEQLYQTAKLIVTGEAIKITLTEYTQHLLQSQMDILYKPELTTHLSLQFSGSVPKEFAILPHWHSFLSEKLFIHSQLFNISQLVFTNNMVVFEYGLDQIIHAMAIHPAGKMTHHNIGETFKCCIKYLIDESRALRVQSYNNYRRRFGLKPAENFEELTGDLPTAAFLKEFYLDIEAVELVVGLLVEHQGTGVAPPTMTAMTGAWLIRGLLSHPINSPSWWKPITFGGEVGMNIVKSATLKKLICLNMKTKCQDIYVGFKIPIVLNKNMSNTS